MDRVDTIWLWLPTAENKKGNAEKVSALPVF
jgi:hypothetical protein